MARFLVLPVLVLLAVLAGCGDRSGVSAPGMAQSSASASGTWVLDTKALEASMRAGLEAAMKADASASALPPEAMEQALAGEIEKLKGASMELVIKDDKTWSAQSKGMGPGDGTASGTWTIAGKAITLVTTMQDGKAREQQDSMSGTWEGDTIRVSIPDAEMPVEMVLRRK